MPGPVVKSQRGRPRNAVLRDARDLLTEKQQMFAAWLAVSRFQREPETFEEMADLLGVSRRTLMRWQRNPKVLHAVRYLQLQDMGDPGRLHDAMDFLYRTFMDEELPNKTRLVAVKEFLDATGVKATWRNPTPDLLTVKETEEIDYSVLSQEELMDLAEQRALMAAQVDGDSEVTEAEVLDD